MKVPFLSLRPDDEDGDRVRKAVARVIDRGWFVLGPEVEAFEAEFARASAATHAVSVGNGTDAIALLLRALGIGPGDEVITSPLTAAYTALAVMMVGARPVFADVDPDRLTLDPRAVEATITSRTRAIVPVHLYGQAADMPAFAAIASRHGLALVEDCCQAHLATCNGRAVGTFGAGGAFSFYPTKNLGALGDGGAIVTGDAAIAERVRRLRNGGQTGRYRHDTFGVNSRLDELQAAILRERLALLPGWTARRRALASIYRSSLAGAFVVVPHELDAGHVYHLFPVRTADRDRFQSHLLAQGVETLVHYPVSLTEQPAFAHLAPAGCPVAERVCHEVCSLPLNPSLADETVLHVSEAVRSFAPQAGSAAGRAPIPIV
jgi:dTDP-3-amino-3,4,6-trideoxy-alpha-D-glucose transaminase